MDLKIKKMEQNKNDQQEKESSLNQKKDNLDSTNSETEETDSSNIITKERILKPKKETFKNIHSKPADEQQFEDNN